MNSRRIRISSGIVLLGIFGVLVIMWTISRRGSFTGNIESLTPEFEATFVRISTSKNWSRGTFDGYGKPVGPLRSNALRQVMTTLPEGALKSRILDLLGIPTMKLNSPPPAGASLICFGAIGTNTNLIYPQNLDVRDSSDEKTLAIPGSGLSGAYNRWIVDLSAEQNITAGQYEVISRSTGEKLFRFTVTEQMLRNPKADETVESISEISEGRTSRTSRSTRTAASRR